MASITSDFLENRKPQKRLRYFVLFGAIIFVLAAGVAGFYFFNKKNGGKPLSPEQVAGSGTQSQLPAEWLKKYFGTENENDPKVEGADGDPDGDILTNAQEVVFGTDPTKADTDGDGEADGIELIFGTNPNGAGDLLFDAEIKDRIAQYINSNENLRNFSENRIRQDLEQLFQPNREIVMQFSEDSELIISNENDVKAFEKYFEATEGLNVAEPSEIDLIKNGLFEMSEAELDRYIERLKTTIKLLKETLVPSQLLAVHKLKIAGLNAGVRMFELVRDNYRDGGDNQFWADFFYQSIAAQSAGLFELEVWHELAHRLQDQGGI